MDTNDVTQRIDRKWFRLDLPPEAGLVGAALVFLIFAIAHRELTGSSAAGMPAIEFLLFPVLASLLGASLLWIVVHAGTFWAGVSGHAPSFAAILLGASIVVCGALLYSAYCLRGGQYCLTINPHLADEAFRHSFSPPVSSPYGATEPPTGAQQREL